MDVPVTSALALIYEEPPVFPFIIRTPYPTKYKPLLLKDVQDDLKLHKKIPNAGKTNIRDYRQLNWLIHV